MSVVILVLIALINAWALLSRDQFRLLYMLYTTPLPSGNLVL